MPLFQSLKKGILYIINSFPMDILFSSLKKKLWLMITVKAKAMVDWSIFYIPNLEKREIAEWDQPALVRLLLTVVKITVKFLIHILSLTYVSFIE